MLEGRSYYTYSPVGHNDIELPQINEIIVNNQKGLIEIDVTNYDSIRWISEGEVVHHGRKLLLKEIPNIGNYVRAEVHGSGNAIIGTQPFGIKEM